jgi:glycosyltransferase involved in cell wall biosynthesis
VIKISVIIAVLNGEKYLRTAIESFLNQDYQNKELIIIDGKSTDSSHQIINDYQKEYPDLISWIKEKDSGISNARNIALKYVKGNIVSFLGADDIFHKDFFNQIAYYAKINPNFDVIYCDGYGISQNNSHFRQASNIAFTKRNLIKFSPMVSGECFLYKRHIFDDFSFNEKNKYSMDYEFNMALVSSDKKYSFYGVAIPAAFNISDGSNISSLLSIKQRAETIAVQLKYTKCLIGMIKIISRRPKFILKNLGQVVKLFNSL